MTRIILETVMERSLSAFHKGIFTEIGYEFDIGSNFLASSTYNCLTQSSLSYVVHLEVVDRRYTWAGTRVICVS